MTWGWRYEYETRSRSGQRRLDLMAAARLSRFAPRAAGALHLRAAARATPQSIPALHGPGSGGGRNPHLLLQRCLCTAGSSGDGDGEGGDDGDKPKKRFGRAARKSTAEPEVAEAKPLDEPPEDAVPISGADDSEDGMLMKYGPDSVSMMPPVLIFPFSNRPLFPGVYQPCEVTNEQLAAALIAVKASAHPFVGVFLPKKDEATGEQPELANVSDPDQIHEVGTLAQITRLSQTPKGVQILLLGGRRVTLGRVVQKEPVMLAKVEEAKDENADDSEGPSLAKAYSMEVMQTIKEVRQRTPRA